MSAHKVIETIDSMLGGYSALNNEELYSYLVALSSSVKSSVSFLFEQPSLPNKFKASYIPLPFEICYYEFKYVNGDIAVAVLYQVDKDNIRGHILQNTPYGIEPQLLVFTITNDSKGVLLNGGQAIRSDALNNNDKAVEKVNEVALLTIAANQLMVCSNITFVEHKAPRIINKKRLKKNKPPIFEYKTLHLKTERVLGDAESEDFDRAGPRVHLRRGHIRHLGAGKTTWVQACVVGNKERGMIVKDYVINE